MQAYVGIDVSKRCLDLAMLIDGKHMISLRIDNDQKSIDNAVSRLADIASGHELVFGCEATGVYHKRLVYRLHELGYRVKVINPRLLHHYLLGQNITTETDKIAARVIAKRLSTGDDRYWQPSNDGNPVLLDLMLRRFQLKSELQRERNRKDRYAEPGFVQESLIRNLKHLKCELLVVEAELKRAVKEDDDINHAIELLRSIPRVGFHSAVAFVARIGDVSRFKTANQVVKFLGLAPKVKISGSSVKKGTLSKQGDKKFRSTIFMATLGLVKEENVYGQHYRGLVSRGLKHHTAHIALMRKIARVMFAVLRDERPFTTELYGKPQITLTSSMS